MREERARHATAGPRWALLAPKGRTVLTAGLILAAAFATAAWAQTAFEPPAVVAAATLVPPTLLTGPGFTVDSQVPVETFLYRFTIRGNVGLVEAHGLAVLPIRVQEVKALQKLQETSGTAEFAQAVEQAGARPIMSAVNMLTHPMDTITGLPVGRTATGGVVVPASLDYVAWIRPMAIFAKRPDLQGTPRIALLAGKLSPVAKQQFAAAGWTV